MRDIISKYESVLGGKPEKKRKFGLLNKIKDSVTGDYFIYSSDIPKKIKLTILDAHGLDKRTNLNLVINNDRVGANDSSFILSNDFISIHSKGARLGRVPGMSLKLALAHIVKIENKLDSTFIQMTDGYEFEIPTNVIIQTDVEINIPKVDSFFKCLNEIVQNYESKINTEEILNYDDLSRYEAQCAVPQYDPFIKIAESLIEKNDLIDSKKLIAKAWSHLNFQVGTETFVEKANPIFDYIYNANVNIEVVESKFYHKSGDSYTALCRLNEINSKFENIKSDKLDKAIAIHKDCFSKDFSKFSLEKRKVLVVAENLPRVQTNTYLQLNREIIPSTEMFPQNNPRIGEIYIAHPYKQLYFERSKYEENLTSERLNEFFKLMRCLGAEKIYFKTNSSSMNQEISSKQVGTKTSADINGVNVGVKTDSERSTDGKEQLDITSSYALEYEPTRAPYLPNDLFWYNYEPEWQRIVDDRLNGNLNHTKSEIKSEAFKALSQNESQSLEAEISDNKLPVKNSVGFGLNRKKSKDQTHKKSINVSIDIYFKHKDHLIN
jgi:hypothetical protein